jgi:hypothetical protein
MAKIVECGDVIKVSEKNTAVIQKAQSGVETYWSAFQLASQLYDAAHKDLMAVIHECYPELEGRNFSLNKVTMEITVLSKVRME